MLNFLKGTRTLLDATEPVCLIIGNESCDLDSAVCALSLAFYYQLRPPKAITEKTIFVPILNIPRKDFPLKTEVTYLLQKHHITAETLTFRDELQVTKNDVILVDHHVSPFAQHCVQVYDHRPFDASAELPANCKLTLEEVGSCATLVAETILQNCDDAAKLTDILQLLHAAIVMDTVNFSVEAARATAKDKAVADQLEKLLGIDNRMEERLVIFQELCAAREDVSALSAYQLLYKDMKIIKNNTALLKVALPGYPISVQEFVQKQDASAAVQAFSKEVDCAIVVLIGMKVFKDGKVKRDIGLLNINNQQLFDEVLRKLLDATEPSLCLKEINNCSFLNGIFFEQGNIKATRKHILPIVKNVLEHLNEDEN